MLDYLFMCIYIDKNKDMIFVAQKEDEEGLVGASEPYMDVKCAEWERASVHIIEMMEEIAEQPLAQPGTGEGVMKVVCKGRGFRQFTKRHICIDVVYQISEKQYIISNCPRLRDGSYGVYSGTLSEKYSTRYNSPCDMALIQENFLKAYADALQYLKEIGSEL